jgi:hypothetical protein
MSSVPSDWLLHSLKSPSFSGSTGFETGLAVQRRIGLAMAGVMFLALFGPVTTHALDYGSIAGSIAYSPSTQVVAAALAGSGESAAVAAVQQCQVQGGADDCWPLDWFYRAVGAFARGSNGAYGSGQGWGDTVGVATDFAKKAAIQTCRDYGGQNCRVIFVKATSDVSSFGTGSALTQPTPDRIGQFIEGLNACVEGRLGSDCAKAAQEVAGVNLDLPTVLSCIKEAPSITRLSLCLSKATISTWLALFPSPPQ